MKHSETPRQTQKVNKPRIGGGERSCLQIGYKDNAFGE